MNPDVSQCGVDRHCDKCYTSASPECPLDSLAMRCREIIDCDTARISTPANKMFLVIGSNRNTKDDEGQWTKDGEPYDFDYVEERVVASGETEDELIASAREYKRMESAHSVMPESNGRIAYDSGGD